MEKVNLEDLVPKVKAGTVSYEEGANIIMEQVFKHKGLFNLNQLTEDELTNYLIFQHKNFMRLLKTYDEKYGTFFTYLKKTIDGSIKTWKKRYVSSRILENSITVSDEILYEENQHKYLLPEEEYFKSEETERESKYCSVSKIETKTDENITENEQQLNKIKQYNLDRKKAYILILALKASYSLDQTIIKKVSETTGISEEEISEMASQIKKTLANKIERREACRRCRDNAYYFHRRYQTEALHLLDGTNWAEIINTKFRKQTKTWIDKNKRLALREYAVSASNIAVGNALGVSSRHVAYVLKKGAENMDNTKGKQYHKKHENISSNRKHEQET